ncbi:MAG: DNA starvation/stationary phase protection protein [Cyclobacteriaceae bacterium]|nr:DNA starvation/stationary phase protection protein [Cyclobacteriaceae bacterium]
MKNELIKSLNRLLSDYQIYYQNLRGFHWNIQGRDFFELHVKFEELYNDATIKIDEVAERILTIGGIPLHTFEDYTQNSKIEAVKNVHNGEKAVTTIIDNLSSIVEVERNIKNTAEELNDSGSADMISAFIEEQEKTLWMFKAWLK